LNEGESGMREKRDGLSTAETGAGKRIQEEAQREVET